MKRIVKLRDLEHLPIPSKLLSRFPKAVLDQARAALCAKNLRFDNRTGKLRDDDIGLIEEYSRPSDFKPHSCVEDVMKWEFSRYIGNSASRITRGFEP